MIEAWSVLGKQQRDEESHYRRRPRKPHLYTVPDRPWPQCGNRERECQGRDDISRERSRIDRRIEREHAQWRNDHAALQSKLLRAIERVGRAKGQYCRDT